MGKKNAYVLGRTIIKDRFGGRREPRINDGFSRHTADIADGYDWGRLNLQSVTEQSTLDDFLATAELAGTEFTAEKMNITFVNPKVGEGLLTVDEKKTVSQAQKDNKQLLSIPRRPCWNSNTSTEELQQRERESFLEWRRQLAELQEVEGIMLTPFEKNLEFWRQLWRVIERSDVVVQIVDARNPLLFRCEDLEKYVVEVGADKMNVILVNKADLLTPQQRKIWAEYFEGEGLPAVFFSALQEYDDIKEESESKEKDDADKADEPLEISRNEMAESSTDESYLKGKLCSRRELIDIFKKIHKKSKVQDGVTTIGLVGYPNVGKSSTINAILTHKKVSVSATPGKTKHFQTLYVDNQLLLCDCPGLVMPTFISTKAEMVVSGILPIDQMKDHVGPINLILSLVPRHVLEAMYGIFTPPPLEGEDPTRPPTSEEFLNAYGYMRGFMTERGLPDNSRASKYVLKDYVNGKVLYCHGPPNFNQDEYHPFPPPREKTQPYLTPYHARVLKVSKPSTHDLDKQFFKKATVGVHLKGRSHVLGSTTAGYSQQTSSSLSSFPTSSTQSLNEKPWKKHRNQKKEKLRRVYSYLDE